MGKFAFDAVAGEPVAEVQREYCFSLYSSLGDTSPQTVTLGDLRMLLTEGEFSQQITKIRGEPDEERQKALKRMLPCVAVSGEFAGGHQAGQLVRHSGLICVDLDADKNPCMLGCAAEWRDRLANDEFVRMAFVSARGNGVAVICRIEAERHGEAFDALQAHFKGQHGLVIDKSCRDVSRMRFLSWDPDVAENIHARTFKRYALAGGGSAISRGSAVGATTNGDVSRGGAAAALSHDRREEILSALERVSPDERQMWLDVGMAIQSEAPGLEGFNLWRRWSEFNDTGAKFNEPDLDRVWRSFKRTGTGIETLFKMAYLTGWKGPPATKRVTGSLPVITADVWLASSVPPRDPVIEGVLDAGTFVELIAPSKARKSFFAMQIANCIACGMKFLKWAVPRARKVMLINVELLADRAHDREAAMTASLGIPREDLSRLIVCNIRGLDIPDPVEAICATIRELRPEVTIIDPLYLIHGEDESDPVAMTALYKRLMAVQTETRSAVVVVHHDAKGKAGDRDKRDRGSGSGVMGRFCDSRILLTPHKDDPENWVCVDMMYRYLPPQKGITVKMEDGRFIEVADVACEPETSKAAVSTMPETQAIRDACEQAKRIILGSEKPMTKTEVKDAISKSKGGTGALSRAKALTEMVATLEVMAADGEAGFEFWRNPKHGGAGWFGTREVLLNSRETNWVNQE